MVYSEINYWEGRDPKILFCFPACSERQIDDLYSVIFSDFMDVLRLYGFDYMCYESVQPDEFTKLIYSNVNEKKE